MLKISFLRWTAPGEDHSWFSEPRGTSASWADTSWRPRRRWRTRRRWCRGRPVRTRSILQISLFQNSFSTLSNFDNSHSFIAKLISHFLLSFFNRTTCASKWNNHLKARLKMFCFWSNNIFLKLEFWKNNIQKIGLSPTFLASDWKSSKLFQRSSSSWSPRERHVSL